MAGKILFGIVVMMVTMALCDPTSASARPARVIDDNDTVTLQGNVHPFARPEFDEGAADQSLPMERMVLALRRDPQKQA